MEDREEANYLDKVRFSYVDIPDGSDLRAVIVGRSTIGEQPVDVVTLVVDAQPHPLSVKFIGLDGQLQGDVSAEVAAIADGQQVLVGNSNADDPKIAGLEVRVGSPRARFCPCFDDTKLNPFTLSLRSTWTPSALRTAVFSSTAG